MRKKMWAFVLSVICCLTLIGCNDGNDEKNDPQLTYTDEISVTGGNIKGYVDENNVNTFKGIPFAAPPVGELRWKEAQDVLRWQGVKECTEWSASAMQNFTKGAYTDEYIISSRTFSEDCLYLNIWSKNDGVKNKPVIVYIHGGGYNTGGASCEVYEGKVLAQNGVVFVSINYRLGIFGYLATSTLAEENPSVANAAMTDQIKALSWVQDNIEAFGGDKQNVTVMGQSAGAGSVQGLLCCEQAEGLFKRAAVLSYDHMNKNFCTMEEKIASGDAILGGKSAEELRQMPAKDLVKLKWDSFTKGALGPCVDEVYIKENYVEALAGGRLADVDILTGMVNDVDTTWVIRDANLYKAYSSEVTNSTEGLMAVKNFFGAIHEKTGYQSDVYVYNMSYVIPGIAGYSQREYGAFHSSDVSYFTGIFSQVRAKAWKEEDYALSKVMSGYLVNFAKSGNPNGGELPEWTVCTGDFDYMNLDTVCQMKQMSENVIADVKAHFQELNAYL